jgi:hypothetical protein
MSDPRRKSIITARLHEDEMRALEALCKQRGMTQVSLLSRMVVWLAHQDGEIQTAILSTGHDDHSKQLRLKLLEQMASAK